MPLASVLRMFFKEGSLPRECKETAPFRRIYGLLSCVCDVQTCHRRRSLDCDTLAAEEVTGKPELVLKAVLLASSSTADMRWGFCLPPQNSNGGAVTVCASFADLLVGCLG